MKINCVLFATLLLLVACKQTNQQPKIFEKNCAFDLELIHFNENVPMLYSKHILNDIGTEYDSVRDGNMPDTLLTYKIGNTITDAMHFNLPEKDFGYLYKSIETDSIAKFTNVYFTSINTLTNKSKKPVGYYATTKFDKPADRRKLLNDIIKKYGQPKYQFLVSNEYNQCSFEWDLSDRTIQIETSYGIEASIKYNGTNKMGRYYVLDMLIIDNTYKSEIYNAHIFNVPNKIMYRGKLHSYKDFQFEKVLRVEDGFFLNSANESLTKDENKEHDISLAQNDE